MARGSGRRQPRDARGRFSSTGATARGGRIKKASGKRATVTANAKGQAPAGTIGRRGGKPSKPSANGIRPTGTLPRPQPGNSIRPTGRRAPRNNVRPYRPATTDGKIGQLDRQIDSTMKGLARETQKLSETIKRVKPKADKLSRRLQRMNAQSIQNRLSTNNADRFVAGVELGAIGSRSGAKAIQRRMQRAADAASRGSKPAARAREIYGNQLAYMGPGKPKAAKNNLRPGPRNKQGPPKRTRKPRKPRK
jgi:hypothetical protein